jgi:peptidoglycan/xylan/chitin deacetylase (PgdA/CDA1 family)
LPATKIVIHCSPENFNTNLLPQHQKYGRRIPESGIKDTFATMRLHWLLPAIKGIPVLMYHRIWPGQQDGLTLTPEQLKQQWYYLKAEGYQALSMQEFLEIAIGRAKPPDKCMLLTFDDGYKNNLTFVYPLLQELRWCATIFLIGNTLDGTATAAASPIDEKLTLSDLQAMDPAVVQLGLHGYCHENFSQHTAAEISTIMQQTYQAFREAGIIFEPVLAYPYGARPKDAVVMGEMKQVFIEQELKAAFRIGNKPQRLPAEDVYELKRIDIRGGDSLEDFKIKLRKGKLKPF